MGVVVGAVVLLIGVAAWSYIPASPQYTLYRLEQAVGANNTADFLKYYKVRQVPSHSNGDMSDDAKLQAFKRQYYRPLNLITTFTNTKTQKETINNPGVIVYLNQPGQHKVVFRLQKLGTTWVIMDAAVL